MQNEAIENPRMVNHNSMISFKRWMTCSSSLISDDRLAYTNCTSVSVATASIMNCLRSSDLFRKLESVDSKRCLVWWLQTAEVSSLISNSLPRLIALLHSRVYAMKELSFPFTAILLIQCSVLVCQMILSCTSSKETWICTPNNLPLEGSAYGAAWWWVLNISSNSF